MQKDIAITRASLLKWHATWHNASAHHWRIAKVIVKVVKHLEARMKALSLLVKSLQLAVNKL